MRLGTPLALFVIATLLPVGGLIGDDLTEEQPLRIDPSGVQADVVETHVRADLSQGAVSAQTHAAAVEASAGGAWVAVADEAVAISSERLLEGTSLQTKDTTTTQAAPTPQQPVADPSQAKAQAAMESVADEFGAALMMEAATATALAAVAIAGTDPSWWRVRLRYLAPLAGLYSRIARSEVLEHDTRESIYELLRERPGLSLAQITDELDLSRSTARHHLMVLEDAGMVRHRTEGRCRIHYPVGRESEALTHHVLRNESRARITELVQARPRSLIELSQELEANPGAVHFHLKKLREAGLVERYENGSVVYRPVA